MPSNNHEQANEDFVRNPEVTYESRDLSARAVVGFIISLMIGGIFIFVLLWGVFKYLAGPYLAPHPAGTLTDTTTRQLRPIGGDPALKFPEPRLQPDPVADLNKFRAREEEILNSYGWVDQENGKVRIPIEAAIDEVAKTGLPTRPAAPAQGISAEQKPTAGAAGSAGGINVKPGAGERPPVEQ